MGPSLTTDRNGVSNSAYAFDGNDYIYTSNIMANEFTNVFTISAWIKSTNNATVHDIFGLQQIVIQTSGIRYTSWIEYKFSIDAMKVLIHQIAIIIMTVYGIITPLLIMVVTKKFIGWKVDKTNTKSNIFNINNLWSCWIGRRQMDSIRQLFYWYLWMK